MQSAKPFPIPVVSLLGPGSQPEEEEAIDYMPMPRDMGTFQPPSLPEPEELAAHAGALATLNAVLAAVREHLDGQVAAPVSLQGLSPEDLALVNQVLGEGEVAAQVTAQVAGDEGIRAQESVFAGIWRVVHEHGGRVVRDTIEVGAFPRAIAGAARLEGRPIPPMPATLPPDTMNAPAVIEQLREQSRAWIAGQPRDPASAVVNLSLLPVTPGDSQCFEDMLGRGRVMVLSRGYGNCRIVDTRAAGVWRVTYFNSQDIIILDTLEVGDVPEVACAARQDLEDSAERLDEVLRWVVTS